MRPSPTKRPKLSSPDRTRTAAARASHAALLEKWRKVMNLVGPGPIKPHLDDADSVARLLGELSVRTAFGLQAQSRWADLGSGAGFPGVALAAHHPEVSIELIESREKRSIFLKRVVQEAALENAFVRHQRAESLRSGHYDGIISRAFAPPDRYLPLAAELVKAGGFIVVLANSHVKSNIADLTEFHVERYRSGRRDRWLIVLRKHSPE